MFWIVFFHVARELQEQTVMRRMKLIAIFVHKMQSRANWRKMAKPHLSYDCTAEMPGCMLSVSLLVL